MGQHLVADVLCRERAGQGVHRVGADGLSFLDEPGFRDLIFHLRQKLRFCLVQAEQAGSDEEEQGGHDRKHEGRHPDAEARVLV